MIVVFGYKFYADIRQVRAGLAGTDHATFEKLLRENE